MFKRLSTTSAYRVGKKKTATRPDSADPKLASPPPTCQSVIDHFYAELAKGGIEAAAIDKELWSARDPNDLLLQIQCLLPQATMDVVSTVTNGPPLPESSWSRLELLLLSLQDLSVAVASVLGMEGRIATILWGAIRLILIGGGDTQTQPQSTQPTLAPKLVEFLDQLRRALPQLLPYEGELPIPPNLSDALAPLYTSILTLLAHLIIFVRNNPTISPNAAGVTRFYRQIFSPDLVRVRSYAGAADEVADFGLGYRRPHTADASLAIRSFPLHKTSSEKPRDRMSDVSWSPSPSKPAATTTAAAATSQPLVAFPCFMVPRGISWRFYERSAELMRVKSKLQAKSPGSLLRGVAIHGMAGVGKSQLALQYANTAARNYDLVAWIPSETHAQMAETLNRLAMRLRLLPEDTLVDEDRGIEEVRNWLNTSGRTYLLVFDNVEDPELLDQIWPSGLGGSIVVTTRSPYVAAERGLSVINLCCFSDEVGKDVMFSLLGRLPADDKEETAASDICHRLGGLPLAMVQISDFIRDRRCPLVDFPAIYDKSADEVYRRSGRALEYEYTTLTAWESAINKLSPEAHGLIGLLAFFDANTPVRESLLMSSGKVSIPSDYFGFGDVVIELVRKSLIHNAPTAACALSLHRLVQRAILAKMSVSDQRANFDLAVKLLHTCLPQEWSDDEWPSEKGEKQEYWEAIESIVPHISWLRDLATKHDIKPTTRVAAWMQALLWSGLYLWEKEQLTRACAFFVSGLGNDGNPSSTVESEARRLLGIRHLRQARPRKALTDFHEALAILHESGTPEPQPSRVAHIHEFMACAYVEISDAAHATEHVKKAQEIRQQDDEDPDLRCRTLVVLALTQLRAGDASAALGSLREAWSLLDRTQEEVATSTNPKDSGEALLLARILWQRRDRDEALELASRIIGVRRTAYDDEVQAGDGEHGEMAGPRLVDAMFHVSRMQAERGDHRPAAKLLCDIIDLCGERREMRAHLARARWFLAGLEAMSDTTADGQAKAASLRKQAKEARAAIEEREGAEEDSDTDEGFMKLVSWMLW